MFDEELRRTQAVAQERAKTIRDLNERVEELETTRSEPVHEDENWSIIRDELHRQTGHIRTLESTNLRLKTELDVYKRRNESIEVLREEKRGLETKLQKALETKDRVAQLEAEVQAAQSERKQWYMNFSCAYMRILSLNDIRSGQLSYQTPAQNRAPARQRVSPTPYRIFASRTLRFWNSMDLLSPPSFSENESSPRLKSSTSRCNDVILSSSCH